MAALGEMTIVFVTDEFENAQEARKHLHTELFCKVDSIVECITGFKGKLKALDVIKCEVYDDVE